MGCGGSKLEADQEATLRPIRRRIEELLYRRNTGVSKKQPLLGDGADSRGSEGGGEVEEIISKDGHSSLLTEDTSPTPQKVISPFESNSSLSISCPKVEDKSDDNSNITKNNEHIVDEKNCEKNKGDDNDEGKNLRDIEIYKGSSQDEEEECTCEDIERMLYSSGSPSFRVYCVHDSLDEDEFNEIAGHDRESSEDCIIVDDKNCLRQESSSPNTVDETQEEVDQAKHTLKKHKRGRKFKKIAIPKGGKNILHNMHALYHFPCHSHNSHHLMQQAAA